MIQKDVGENAHPMVIAKEMMIVKYVRVEHVPQEKDVEKSAHLIEIVKEKNVMSV